MDLISSDCEGGGDIPSRWSRARPRPATRTLTTTGDDEFADLLEGIYSIIFSLSLLSQRRRGIEDTNSVTI